MSFRPLKKTSDLYFAIADAIHAAGLGVEVANYHEFDFEGSIGDATILIELESTAPRERNNDGRRAREVLVTLHAVVARCRGNAPLEAANLAGLLEDLADLNRWGFHGSQCEYPSGIHSGPSIFQRGEQGYEAWGCTFRQAIATGASKVPEDPAIASVPQVLAAWEVPAGDTGAEQ